jgi:MoaA/NifB/PqqE/SkfB family radical SAM enzyme
MELVKQFNASIIQLIHPKPAGGWLAGGGTPFSEADIERVRKLVHRYNRERAYRHYPSISAQVIEEHSSRFGCTAGGNDRVYINAQGDVQPCEFLNLSFGNVGTEDFRDIYVRMRSRFRTPSDGWLCQTYSEQILQRYRASGAKRLPLAPDLSDQLCQTWDRGTPTPLYVAIEQKLR